jgi:hypothetical protein
MCDFKTRKAFICKDASKCDLLDVNTARSQDLVGIWEQIGIYDPVLFIYKPPSPDSKVRKACTPWAKVTASDFEYIWVINKGDYCCGEGNRKVFQCKSSDEGLCFATSPD